MALTSDFLLGVVENSYSEIKIIFFDGLYVVITPIVGEKVANYSQHPQLSPYASTIYLAKALYISQNLS